MIASSVGRTSARPACCSAVCLDRPAYRFENVPRVYSSGGAAQLDGSPQIVSGGKLWNPLTMRLVPSTVAATLSGRRISIPRQTGGSTIAGAQKGVDRNRFKPKARSYQ